MRLHIPRRLSLLAPLIVTMLVLLACGGTATVTVGAGTPGGGTPGSGTATATHSGSGPTATPVPAPPHAFAWVQFDGSHVPQIWASINGGTPSQITHLTFSGDGCSPDELGPARLLARPHAHCLRPRLHLRRWSRHRHRRDHQRLDRHRHRRSWRRERECLRQRTLLRLGQQQPGLDHQLRRPLRVHARRWQRNGAARPAGICLRGRAARLDPLLHHRHRRLADLHRAPCAATTPSSHSLLGGSINLGTVHSCACSPGDAHFQGWDVSPDGAHVAYQVTTASGGPDFGIASSTIYYANADGSGASQIASYMATTGLVRMRISPNGQLVAFTNATPSPSVITASVSSPGHAGDPNFHAYTPDAVAFPAWKWDSSQFWAATAEDSDAGFTHSDLRNYVVGAASGTIGVANGYNPWYTIGS